MKYSHSVEVPVLLTLLFPFSRSYRALELPAKWWHRLSMILLLLMVFGTLFGTWWTLLSPEIEARKLSLSQVQTEEYAQDTTGTSEQRLPEGFSKEVIIIGRGKRILFPSSMNDGDISSALCKEWHLRDAACWKVIIEHPSKDNTPPPIGMVIDESQPYPRTILAGGLVSAVERASRPHIIRDLFVSLLVALVVSYILQLLYRAIIFVVFGIPETL